MAKFAITRIEEYMKEYDETESFLARCDLAKRFRIELTYIVDELWKTEEKANGGHKDDSKPNG